MSGFQFVSIWVLLAGIFSVIAIDKTPTWCALIFVLVSAFYAILHIFTEKK